jgi:hypothetical protein
LNDTQDKDSSGYNAVNGSGQIEFRAGTTNTTHFTLNSSRNN